MSAAEDRNHLIVVAVIYSAESCNRSRHEAAAHGLAKAIQQLKPGAFVRRAVREYDQLLADVANVMITCTPLPPPFPVATRLRHIGTRRMSTSVNGGPEVDLIAPGMEVVIDEVKPGRRGTGRHLTDCDGLMYYDDEETDPILDETKHGYCVYHINVPGRDRPYGRIISHSSKHEWEIVK